MTSYYAATYITQGEEVFSCTWDFSCEDVNNPTRKELINHLAEMIEEHNNDLTDGWERDDDVRLNLFEMIPYEFANELVMHEAQSTDHYDTQCHLNVNQREVDPENWEHPCNI